MDFDFSPTSYEYQKIHNAVRDANTLPMCLTLRSVSLNPSLIMVYKEDVNNSQNSYSTYCWPGKPFTTNLQ